MAKAFDLFRKKMNNEDGCRMKFEAYQTIEGSAATEIFHYRSEMNRAAAVVPSDKEGPDSSIVYTYKEKFPLGEVQKGDYFLWNDVEFFVYEDVFIPHETIYKKQMAYQCNVQVLDEDQVALCGGYFVSSLHSYLDTTLQAKINISDKEKPVLIIPYQPWIAVNVKLVVGGKPWKITDFDHITNSGIAYISLTRDFFQKHQDVEEVVSGRTLVSGQEYEFDTVDGYFDSSSPLFEISKTSTKVKITVPYNYTELQLTTKAANGELITTTYKVVR